LLFIDVFCISVSYYSAVYMLEMRNDTRWWAILGVLLLAYLASAANVKAYGLKVLSDPAHAAIKGVQSFALAIAVIVFAAFAFKASEQMSRAVVALGATASLFSLAFLRYILVSKIAKTIGRTVLRTTVILDGDFPVPIENCSVIRVTPEFFDPLRRDQAAYERLTNALQGTDRVVIACDSARRSIWACTIKGLDIQGEILAPELGDLGPLGVARYLDDLTLVIARGPMGLSDRILKRTFDVIVAAFFLLLLSPVLIAVAVAIKLDSPGPIFFRQPRIGRGNTLFEVLKFRSMYTNKSDGAGHESTKRNDPRITKVGNFIRKTSLDELPQLLNVIRGDMSIVGPRPHPVGSRAAEKLFWEVDARYWHRHAAKPGLTGLAQVRGYRGATPFEVDLLNRLQADLEYLDTWSIWRDIQIMIQTIRVIVHDNAY
jgi:polysaccharide biosynthesis protein PslA